MAEIGQFEGDYFFMSNFFEEPDGSNVEAEFQSMKTKDRELRQKIRNMAPKEAKRAGNALDLRPDWEQVKVPIMSHLVALKFYQHGKLAKRLVATGNGTLLREGNYWHDNFWGDCTCAKCKRKVGQNVLGIVLMGVRANAPLWVL